MKNKIPYTPEEIATGRDKNGKLLPKALRKPIASMTDISNAIRNFSNVLVKEKLLYE